MSVDSFFTSMPSKFVTSAGTTVVATTAGFAYGFLGRKVYPLSGVIPFHYGIEFALAFQIMQFILQIEKNFRQFLKVESYFKKLEMLSEDELDLEDRVRFHCWKIIQLKNQIILRIDNALVFLFKIRPHHKVTKDNVEQASFIEMCRYRIWPVFKLTVLETLSFRVAFLLCNGMGFKLPVSTSVPRVVIISSIVREIIIIPALYTYANWCQKSESGEKYTAESLALRAKWIRYFLPSLTLSMN